MKWSDLFNADKMIALGFKLFFVAFAVVVVGELVVLISSELSGTDLGPVLIFLAVVSIIAYFIRERRVEKKPRPRNIRGAERTPVLPRMEREE